MLWRDRLTARQPLGQIGIGEIEESLQHGQLVLREGGKPCRHEATDQQIVFMSSTMRGAKQKPPAARIGIENGFGHG